MQKKVFLQRNLRKTGGGSSPLLKYLVLAVVVATLMVLIIPHVIKQKGSVATRRSMPEKGTVMKELPKPPEPTSRETVPEMAQSSEPAPAPAKPPEQEGMNARVPASEALPLATPPAEKEQTQTAKSTEPPALFPKQGSMSAFPSASQKPSPVQPPARAEQKVEPGMTASAQPTAKTGQKPGIAGQLSESTLLQPAKKIAVVGKQMYAVQVGCFRERQSAEEIQRNLIKRGYDVILCPSAASSGGSYAYTVMTKPVDNIRKAATVVEQIKNEQKVSPTIIKMPPVCDMGGGKQPVQKAQVGGPGQAGQ